MIENWVRGLSFKNKLVFSFSLILGLTFILGAALLHSLFGVKRQAEDYERLRASQNIAAACAQIFTKMRSAVDGYLLGVSSDRQRYEGYVLEMEKALARMERLSAVPMERENARNLEMAFKTFQARMDPVIKLADEGQRREAIAKMDEAALSTLDGIGKRMEMLSLSVNSQAEQAWGQAKRLAHRAMLSSAILFVSILLAGAGLSLGLYRSITYPLAKLREGARKVSEGVWEFQIDVWDPPELVSLARSFEEMARSLTTLQVHITQLDRMSAMGTLAGGVAHEINNPLTGVLGQAQFLLEKLSPTDPLRSNVEKIERAALKCRKIVRGLLDFSRPSDYIFQAFDVGAVIERALGLCESEMALKNVRIRRIHAPSLPKVWASENHLEQVFINIFMNALQAMPEGGTLTLETWVERPLGPAGQPWKDALAMDREYVAVSFTDTGIGIDPKDAPHIFDPFFTTKEPGKGTGLGLSISYNIIKTHHGEITVFSPGPGKGATFTVKIPAVHEERKAKGGAPFETLQKRLEDFDRRMQQ